MNWNEVKIRCSSLGCLFVEPQSKEDKTAGRLSKTAQAHLRKIYIQHKWNRRKEVVTKHMKKGNLVQEEATTLLSRIDKRIYVTNTERKENSYTSGLSDIIDLAMRLVIDIKASWEAETFIENVSPVLDKMYYHQLQGYMWLWGLERAKLSYCLVNTPDMLIKSELRKLLFNMDVATDEDPEYKKAAEELIHNMIFDDIPIEERVISLYAERDEEVIRQIPEKVIKAREFLVDFERQHLAASRPLLSQIKLIAV